MSRAPTPPFTKMFIVLRQGVIVRGLACTVMGGLVAAAVGVTLGLWIIFAGLFCMIVEYAVYARFHDKADRPYAKTLMLGTTVLAAFSFVVSAPILLASDTGPAGFMGALFIGTMLIYQAVYYGHDQILAKVAVPPLIASIAFCFGLMAYQAFRRGEYDVAVMVAIMCPVYAIAVITLRTVLHFRSKKLRKLKADAESSSRAKSEFLANMSHEIRTPMNGIIAMSDMLQSSGLTPTQQQYADIITSSGENLLVIINDILDFSKLEARKLELDPAAFDLLKTVEEVASLIAPKTDQGVDVATFIDPQLPNRLIGDPVRIRQVLLNLAGNAAKFTKSGSIMIVVTRSEDATPEEGRVPLSIRIHDTGIGIKPDQLDSMFEKFSQANSGTSKLYGGTGLGLAICKDLISLMNGTVVASSVWGQGSVFGFDLALPVAPDAQMIATGLPGLQNCRTVILSRTYALHWSLHCLLARQGAQVAAWVDASADPNAPLRQIGDNIARDAGPDLIIMDHRIEAATLAAITGWLQSLPPAHRPALIRLGLNSSAVAAIPIPVRARSLLETADSLLAKSAQSVNAEPLASLG